MKPPLIRFSLICLLLIFSIGCAQPPAATPTAVPVAITPATGSTLVPATPTLHPDIVAREQTRAALPPTPTATPTPLPAEQVEIVATALFHGDVATAAGVLDGLAEAGELSAETRIQRATLHLADNEYSAAVALLSALDPADRDRTPVAAFHLGTAFAALGDCANAELSYNRYLSHHPDMAAYVEPRIADCYAAIGSSLDNQLAFYERAATTPAHFLVTYRNRLRLAQLYTQVGRHTDAADLYALIGAEARTDFTRGEMVFRAAEARRLAGDSEAALAGFRRAVADWPTQATSHQALVQLINAGEPVDPLQRSLVNYHAGSSTPCITVLTELIANRPNSHPPEALRLLALCHEQVGAIETALARLADYAALSPETAAPGLLEQAHLLRRQQRPAEARALYERLADQWPDAPESADALWWAARLADWAGDGAAAREHYDALGQRFSTDSRAPEATFRAAWLAHHAGETEEATALWQRAFEWHPNSPWGQAALAWLLQTVPDDGDLRDQAAALPPQATWYNSRIQDLLADVAPFAPPPGGIDLTNAAVLDQDGAEAALREALGLEADRPIRALPPFVADDPHFTRGLRLQELGLLEAARSEFDFLREGYANNALVSYQLALAFRDSGFYRPSIQAAGSAINLAGWNGFTAPPFLASLAYPVYYADLILPLAEAYEFDPLLQFALVRQESLFESFATSTAVAQGLAQVIPATGAYIATRLGRTDFVNEDLYKPHVGLEFGAYYLAEQLRLFDGAAYAALAAYNGGPGNAYTWLQRVQSADPATPSADLIDRYLEIVNFPETRLYIERIYTGHAIYRQLYGADRGERQSQ